MNSLLDFSGLPRFQSFQPALVAPAICGLIADAERCVAMLTTSNETPTWTNVITPLEDVTEKLSRAWGMVAHLNAVVNSPTLRGTYNTMLPVVTQLWSALSQNALLFDKYKQIRASAKELSLSDAQKRALDNQIRDFRLGGADLSDENKLRFKSIQESLSTLMSAFNDHVLDATNAFAHIVSDKSQLDGLPADCIEAARAAAQQDKLNGWKFTLHAPSYMPVMQYAAHQPLRATLYQAFVTRASELGADSKWDNSDIIRQILQLRAESAALLGYKNYGEVSLAPKMAHSPDEVFKFLDEMTMQSKPFAEKDWREMVEFANDNLGLTEVNAWDVPFVSEKLREQRYVFSDNDVKQYFPEENVIAGLFRVVESIYGVKIVKSTAETWHDDVSFYDVMDACSELIGQFYFDLYARQNKRGGAWMNDAINRRRVTGRIQHPVAYMTCNFPAPVSRGDQLRPALFTHNHVITLFHEFGHGLHQLLTEVDELAVSGISGVEWDAVELPSQFMENFCWEWDVLRHMTAHVETGAPLPRELFDKMIAAKNFQSGMGFVRQLEFATLDMHAHTDFDFDQDNILDLATRVRAAIAVVPYPDFNRMPHAFAHIFGGGYAAGYYSYKWAEVLSADAYAAFEEEGVLNRETGNRFRREVLARGGSRGAMESFIAFRGRAPEISHLLRHNGMKLAA